MKKTALNYCLDNMAQIIDIKLLRRIHQMGRLEYPDDTLCQMFGPLGEKLAAILIAIDDKSIPTPVYPFHEPQARNEADWDDEKESKMIEIIYTFLRRMPPSALGYKRFKLIWYREGNIVSEEEIPTQRV